MKISKQKAPDVILHWQEFNKGETLDKSYKTDKKSAEYHMQLMQNNPYVHNPRVEKIKIKS